MSTLKKVGYSFSTPLCAISTNCELSCTDPNKVHGGLISFSNFVESSIHYNTIKFQ